MADRRYSLIPAIMAGLLIVLFIVPDGFDYAGLTTSGAPLAGSMISRLLWLLLLGSAVVVIAGRASFSWLLLRRLNPFLILFVALAAASTAWSIDPVVTARRILRLTTVLLVAISFVLIGWHPGRFQSVVRPMVTLMLFGSLIFGMLAPELAIHQEVSDELIGAWRGLTNHKNSLGELSGIGVILWFHAWMTNEVRRSVALCGLSLSMTCLLLSRSSTSLLATAFVVMFLLLYLRSPRTLHRYMPYLVSLLAGTLLIYSLAILRLVPGTDAILAPITALTGKDLSFTGRSDIWAIMSDHIRLQPYWGTGYGAYWTPTWNSPSAEFILRLNFYPGSAHNGYLEIVNDLGFAGLACLIGYLVCFLRQALQLARSDRAHSALFLALFLHQGIANLSESHWLCVTSITFAIMTLATTALARALLDLRLREYFGHPRPWLPLAAGPRSPLRRAPAAMASFGRSG